MRLPPVAVRSSKPPGLRRTFPCSSPSCRTTRSISPSGIKSWRCATPSMGMPDRHFGRTTNVVWSSSFRRRMKSSISCWEVSASTSRLVSGRSRSLVRSVSNKGRIRSPTSPRTSEPPPLNVRASKPSAFNQLTNPENPVAPRCNARPESPAKNQSRASRIAPPTTKTGQSSPLRFGAFCGAVSVMPRPCRIG